MTKPQQNLRTFHRFPESKPSKTLQEEDHFMHVHGGAGPRAVYLTVEAISACLGAIFSAPLRLLLKLIDYDHPLENRRPAAASSAQFNARHRRASLKRSTHANTFHHPKSTPKRRA